MLKTGELDIAYNMGGDEATAVTRDPTLRLRHTLGGITTWLEFLGQWDPASPWHDRRVRLAANLAIDKQAMIEATSVGFNRPTGPSSPERWRSPCRSSRFRTIRGRRSACWPRPATPRGLTPAT
jgi:peptide/nickel transport system substrate-binding protein